MCGIYASISTHSFKTPNERLKQLLRNRGPDHTGELSTRVHGHESGTSYWISLFSTVLALRGGQVVAQPFVDSSSNSVLCWNGEAWKIGLDPVLGNDGDAVFDLLIKATSEHKDPVESTAAVLNILRSISGPFAFVFLDVQHKQLYFGRDRLGRRSLLYKSDKQINVQFSSVADDISGGWLEVEADAVYSLSLASEQNSCQANFGVSFATVCKHMWVDPYDQSSVTGVSTGIFNRTAPSEDMVVGVQTASVQSLRWHLSESLKLRVLNIPLPPTQHSTKPVRLAVLFSGGLDCTLLARMAHDIIPLNQQIDLINVAFENPRVVKAAKKAASVQREPSSFHTNKAQDTPTNHAPARSPYEACPDRETGRKSFQELQTVCPNRVWQFVLVNVPYGETIEHRERVIQLIHPHNTEMDLSIAYALYFASRGAGQISTDSCPELEHYETPARVLLSGLGADELFGGYTRHATAYHRTGFMGLLDELKLDIDRLGKRNLGRDDRVICYWAKEVRFPYLDENLVKWAVESPVWEKCGFGSNDEASVLDPSKKVLRLLACDLGMHSVATEKKRAIQFGARTAKMEIGKTKGTTLLS